MVLQDSFAKLQSFFVLLQDSLAKLQSFIMLLQDSYVAGFFCATAR